MPRFGVTIAVATVFVAGAPIMGASVGMAAIVAPGAIRAAVDSLNVVESVQFIWLGHNYCWYDDGWNGPGWYWCDYSGRVGLGWGGGYGWHHWRGGHPGGGKGGEGGGKSVSHTVSQTTKGRTVSHATKGRSVSQTSGAKSVSHASGARSVSHTSGGGPQIHSGGGGGGGSSGKGSKQH